MKRKQGKLKGISGKSYGLILKGDKPHFIPVSIACWQTKPPSSRSSHYCKRMNGIEETLVTPEGWILAVGKD